MNRFDQYAKFLDMVSHLILHAQSHDIPIRLGEAHRPKFVAEKYVKEGTGILNSKHRWSLAIDIWIIDAKTGKEILWKDPRYDILGKFWESLTGIWGGHFERYDPYHFECGEKPA